MKMGFESCGPHEALVITGCKRSSSLMICGPTRVWIWPAEKCHRLSLNTFTRAIYSNEIKTSQGLPVCCVGITQVKIQGKDKDMLAAACEQFLGKSEKEIADFAQEIIEGHQNAIISTMTVEDIYQKRRQFSTAVFEASARDLADMGISIVSYTLKDVSDNHGYLTELGRERAEQRKKAEQRIQDDMTK